MSICVYLVFMVNIYFEKTLLHDSLSVIRLISLSFFTFSIVFQKLPYSLVKKKLSKIILCFFRSSVFISMHNFNQDSRLILITLYTLCTKLIHDVMLVLNFLYEYIFFLIMQFSYKFFNSFNFHSFRKKC